MYNLEKCLHLAKNALATVGKRNFYPPHSTHADTVPTNPVIGRNNHLFYDLYFYFYIMAPASCCKLLPAVASCCQLLQGFLSCHVQLLPAATILCQLLVAAMNCCQLLAAAMKCCQLFQAAASCSNLLPYLAEGMYRHTDRLMAPVTSTLTHIFSSVTSMKIFVCKKKTKKVMYCMPSLEAKNVMQY